MKKFCQVMLVIATAIGLLLAAGCYEQPPYSKASGERIHLINKKFATDPTWFRLETFLLVDDTDDTEYNPEFTCGDFAEMLHNNAEEAGIRAAFVVVEFTEGEPHALNAFRTTDRGLVYIDCTGPIKAGYSPSSYTLPIIEMPKIKEFKPEIPEMAPFGDSTESAEESLPDFTGEVPDFIEEMKLPDVACEYDKVAYISVGAELGVISLEITEGCDYSRYEDYKQMLDDYDVAVEAQIRQAEEYNAKAKDYSRKVMTYNARVEDYNKRVALYDRKVTAYNRGENFYGGEKLDYHGLMREYDQLNIERTQLEKESIPLEGEYEQLDKERNQLNEEAARLTEMLETVGYFYWEPMGVVSNVEIWW